MRSAEGPLSVLDALKSQIAVLNADGAVISTNAAWRASNPDRRLAPRFAAAAADGLAHVLARRRETFSLEYPFDPGDTGDPRWFSLRIAPTSDGGALVRHIDITDRRRTERSLLETQQRFRAMFEMSMDAILLEDDAAVIVDANPAACKLLGRSQIDLLGRTCWTLLGVAPDLYEAARKKFLDEGEMHGEFVLPLEGGTPVDVEFTARARVLPGLHMLTLRDITRRRQLEQQVLQSQKMETVGRLAGGVAHDFNNLLTAILGYADLLVDQHEEGDPRRNDAIEIRTAALRASVLTRQLLTFSRSDRSRPQRVDLNNVITSMHQLLSRMIGEHMIAKLALALHVPPVRADLGQIEQVIANLAVNARDAMPDGGDITFATAVMHVGGHVRPAAGEVVPGEYVEIAVSDRGTGIPADVLPRIFDPFFTTKDQGKGTGLGLSTVYGIVTGCGGHILVETAPGEGTTFRVRLPALVDPE